MTGQFWSQFYSLRSYYILRFYSNLEISYVSLKSYVYTRFTVLPINNFFRYVNIDFVCFYLRTCVFFLFISFK